MTEAVVVLVTTSGEDEANRIACALVDERLVACVNLLGAVRSIYRWQGEVQSDAEVVMMIKTTRDRFDVVERRVRELHSYEVPEVIAIPIAAGSAPYLDWIAQQVSAAEPT